MGREQEHEEFNRKLILDMFENFKEKNILVIGDSILDSDVYLEYLGQILEAPTLPKFKHKKVEFSYGGAANVVKNILALGGGCSFITLIGDDEYSKQYEKFKDERLNFLPVIEKGRKTTVKQRFWIEKNNFKILKDKIDHLDNREIQEKEKEELIKILEENIKEADIVLLVDYRHGMMSYDLIQKIKRIVRENNKLTIVSSQVSQKKTNHLDYSGLDLICLNLKEAKEILPDFNKDRISELGRILNSNICLTLGKEGSILNLNGNEFRAGGIKVKEIDPCGAGDSFLAALSLTDLNKTKEALYLANSWAGLSVTKIGTKIPEKQEFLNLLNKPKISFGNTFGEVSNIKHPDKKQTEYGNFIEAVNESEFSLKVFSLNQNYKGPFNFQKGVFFIEKGEISIASNLLKKGTALKVSKEEAYEIEVKEESLIYFFTSPDFSMETDSNLEISETFDIRDKYWGKIESIISEENFAGKRIFMNAGKQSSLEYHINKKETYFLQSGRLKIGLRVGRAENKSIILNPGDVFIMDPGLMHMRIALEDSLIFEISTRDDDKDSHLVEDGKSYIHKEIPNKIKDKIKTIEELKEISEKLKSEGKIIVTTNGSFDILHYAHVSLLEAAKKEGDILIVLLNSDSSIRNNKGDKRPIIPQQERAKMLAALEFVDYITVFDEPKPFLYLEKIKPQIHMKGTEVTGETRAFIAKWGGQYKTLGFKEGFSTTNIIKKIIEKYND